MRSESGIPRPFQPNNQAQELRDLKREVEQLKARRSFVSVERIVEGGTINKKVGTQLTEVVQKEIVIDGGNLGEGALDGQRMVGAIIETNDEANRGVKIDDNGLRGYDADGDRYMKADETGLEMTGSISTKGKTAEATPRDIAVRLTTVTRDVVGQVSVPNPSVVFDTGDGGLGNAPGFYSPNGSDLTLQARSVIGPRGEVRLTPAAAKLSGNAISIGIDSIVWPTESVTLAGKTITIGYPAVLAPAANVNLDGNVKVNGAAYGAPQERVQPPLNAGWSQWTASNWNGIWIEQMGKLTIITGAVSKATWAAGETIANLPARFRPANKASGNNCEVQANGDLNIGAAGSGASALSITYFAA